MLKFIKKSSFLLFILLLFLSVESPVQTEDLDPCWIIPCLDTEYMQGINPDTLAIDTCGFYVESGGYYFNSHDWCEEIRSQKNALVLQFITQKRYYSKRGWHLRFEVMAIKLPWAPEDSILECNWNAIDTAYPEIRQGFQELEEKYGNLILRKSDPCDTTYSYYSYKSQIFTVHFQNWLNTVEVAEALNNIPKSVGGFSGYFDVTTSFIIENEGKSNSLFEVYPNPSENKITIKINEINNNNNSINIYSLDGKLQITQLIQYSSETIDIDTSKLINGIYLVIYNNQQTKIVIRR
jgi:hypothetical protein